jgi:hypothetical protein
VTGYLAGSLITEDKICKKESFVNYEGWTTEIMPEVAQSWTTGEYISITLVKKDKKVKSGYRIKIVSLEDKETMKIFKKFIETQTYDHYWVQ